MTRDPYVRRHAKKPIRVPDVPGPTAQLCWKQKLDPPGVMGRCDRRKGHTGPHSWECQPKEPHDG